MDINKYIKTYKKDTFSLILVSITFFNYSIILSIFYFYTENINSPEFFENQPGLN